MSVTFGEPYLVHVVDQKHGINVHVPGRGTRVLSYGDELLIDQETVEANLDRNGDCLLLCRVEDGEVFAKGPWPEGKSKLIVGSLAWQDARENARRAAHAITDDDERRAALAKFRAEWDVLPTSKTLMEVAGA
jgi:hypothetical protein